MSRAVRPDVLRSESSFFSVSVEPGDIACR
jgi:hypothetical protein